MPVLEDTATDIWNGIYREGAIFQPVAGSLYKQGLLFETIRRYQPVSGSVGPHKIVLARIHETSLFHLFQDNFDASEIEPVQGIEPVYQSQTYRGLVKENEDMHARIASYDESDTILCEFHCDISALRFERRIPSDELLERWVRFRTEGAVFRHKGFRETFETFRWLNLPDVNRKKTNEVILARSYDKPVFVEFTVTDLRAMELTCEKPKYTRKEGNTTYLGELSLDI